jgi:hypothetical protein
MATKRPAMEGKELMIRVEDGNQATCDSGRIVWIGRILFLFPILPRVSE